jgi:hypothetical protein
VGNGILSIEEQWKSACPMSFMLFCLAAHPAAGDIMQGTSGIRKLRWSAQGKDKSGGVRVIYYH